MEDQVVCRPFSPKKMLMRREGGERSEGGGLQATKARQASLPRLPKMDGHGEHMRFLERTERASIVVRTREAGGPRYLVTRGGYKR